MSPGRPGATIACRCKRKKGKMATVSFLAVLGQCCPLLHSPCLAGAAPAMRLVTALMDSKMLCLPKFAAPLPPVNPRQDTTMTHQIALYKTQVHLMTYTVVIIAALGLVQPTGCSNLAFASKAHICSAGLSPSSAEKAHRPCSCTHHQIAHVNGGIESQEATCPPAQLPDCLNTAACNTAVYIY